MSDPPSLLASLDPARVAEVLVTVAGGQRIRGSGYQVSVGAVLTAAHVVRGAESLTVRFSGGLPAERLVPGTVLPLGAGGDVAIVILAPPGSSRSSFPPALFGALGDRAAVVEGVVAVGFPRFKLHESELAAGAGAGWYRDRVQAVGRIPVLSNSKEGTLEFITDPPAADSRHSPWEGMSGAAVWAGGHIVGVVSKHHAADSPARLSVARMDRWLSALPAGDRAAVAGALGLPDYPSALADVIAPSPAEALARGYLDQVRDLAPAVLLDRGAELTELARFCAGDQQYGWWQAGPWAGKSALAAWLVLHPPPGVAVASFFITSRWAGHADSDAFTTEIIQQLAAIAGEPAPDITTPAAREQARRYLLGAAAARCEAAGGRLLLVVDGLDEDQSASPGGVQLPSIASLLPARPPAVVRVLVTSRPEPGLPSDMPGGHPLTECTPHQLIPSPHAQELAGLARAELKQRRASTDTRVVDVLGYLTASGGGLTRKDLAALAGIPGWMLQDLLSSVFGRTVRGTAARAGDRVYLFAHETLREQASELFADDLPGYRQGIYRWASGYRDTGWPVDTPRYLLAPFGRVLADAAGDAAGIAELVVLAADPARHDRMLAAEHNDAAALAEILAARRALSTFATAPDLARLAALGKLAVSQWRLQIRNFSIPAGLPVVWALLGDPDRAEQVVATMDNPATQAPALAAVAALAARNSDRARRLAEDAELTARTIANPALQADMLAGVATALAASDPRRAELIARSIDDPGRQAEVLAAVATALAASDPRRAELIARSIDDPGLQADTLAGVAASLMGSDLARAARLSADALAYLDEPAAAGDAFGPAGDLGPGLTGLIVAFALGDPDRVQELLDDAEQFAASLTSPGTPLPELAWIARLAAGDYAGAEIAARAVTEPGRQAEALACLAAALAGSDRDRARKLAAAAEHAVTVIPGWQQSQELARVAASLSAADPGRAQRLAGVAEQAARTGTDLGRQADARLLTSFAAAVAATELDSAEQAARALTDPYLQARALAGVAAAVAPGDPERGRQLAADAEDGIRFLVVINPDLEAEILADAAAMLAASDRDRAQQLAAEVEQAARAVALAGLQQQADLMSRLTAGLAASDPVGAERAACAIADPARRAEALAGLAGALAGSDGNHAVRLAADAERIILASTDPGWQAEELAGLAAALGTSDGDTAARLADDAERIIRASADPAGQPGAPVAFFALPGSLAEGLTGLAAALAATDPGRARRLAADAEQSVRVSVDPSRQAVALASVAAALAGSRPDRAEQAARAITDPGWLAKALADVAAAVAHGDPGRAGRLAADAEQAARAVTGSPQQVLAGLAATLAASDPGRARRLAVEAGQAARAISNPYAQPDELAVVAATLARSHPDQAEEAARAIGFPYTRARALAGVAAALVVSDPERCGLLAADADQAAQDPMLPDFQPVALAEVAVALAVLDPGRAEDAARTIADPYARALAAAGAVHAVMGADPDCAMRLAAVAEQAAGDCGSSEMQSHALARVAAAFAVGDPGHARLVLSQALSAAGVFSALPVLLSFGEQAASEVCEHTLLCLGVRDSGSPAG